MNVKEIGISELCKIQEHLDDRIINEKKIEWTEKERFLNTLVALDVELSEFANEGRWFKRWSNDQEPRTLDKKMVYDDDPNNTQKAKFVRTNPLLEEYVDSLHFFLSLANQRGWQERLYLYKEAIDELRDTGFHGGMNGVYLELKLYLSRLTTGESDELKSNHFHTAWFLFISIGLIQFNFTMEQIFTAYLEKNKVNHQRQDSGY